MEDEYFIMNNLLDSLEEVLLMGPGPSCVPSEVYKALSCWTIGHLDPKFIEIMDEIQGALQKILNTENRLTLPISGTGSAGMETCFVNLIEKGDAVLVLTNGVFGTRMQEVSSRLGAQVYNIDFEWGKPIDPNIVKEQLEKKQYKILAVVHAETSTGVQNPIGELSQVIKDEELLLLVDTVTSLGGMEIKMDEWGIDALYSGTQKCLSCPPGLAPVSFSQKAINVLSTRKTKVPNWYLDINLIAQYWSGEKSRVYHHTAPINMLYGLYQALLLIIEEGVDSVYKRHRENHLKLVEGLEKLGLDMYVEESYRLPMLNAVTIPNGINDIKVRSTLLNKHKIEIGGGLGPLAGKIWRIGLMGHTARAKNVDRFLRSLTQTIKELNY